MKTRLARLALAGGVALLAAAPAVPASADCGPVVRPACAVLCSVQSDPVHRICTVL
jgi:hypothetical protein